jgi:diguanylate cyclase (GGDEF)-like protein
MNSSIRVLLIEDDLVDQIAFKRAVKEQALPFDYHIAGSLSEARRFIDSERFDVIICDYLLGDGIGTELLGWQQDAPVILLTGSGSEDIAVEAMKTGAYDYLVKDAEGRHLKTISVKIENTLNRRKTNEALKLAKQELNGRTIELEARNRELVLLGEELRLQSITDPLTGLFNRRYMESAFEKEVRRAVRKESPLSVTMLDIDHFKRVNDTFGHNAGDFVLQELGKYLSGSIRAEDTACRYGGEEFCLIMPDCPLGNAQRRLEKIIGVFKLYPLEYGGIAIGPVTLSAGVAAYPTHASSPHDLLKAADGALYCAKSEGRDMVVTAGCGLALSEVEEKNHTREGIIYGFHS